MAARAAFAQSLAVTGLAGETAELNAVQIAALPHQPVTLQLEGKSEACEAVPLSQVLAKVDAPQGKALRGPELADVVEVRAADGYRIALALAETDELMRGEQIFLADRCSGGPIAAPEGPFRLIVLGDKRPARSARQVTAIRVLRLPAGS
ncbi:MAG TPA: molybdopterin-binding oxidoreductase [Caulobacteraceae bacterium]|nr:molybdopterin-binding oxidoreductase [Caulobacteraceae bacterium]